MVLAARGLRDMDDGAHRITDRAELAEVRRQARKVHLETLAFAAILTALLVALP